MMNQAVSPPWRTDVACSTDVEQAAYVRFLDGFAGEPGVALGYHYPFYLQFLAATAYRGSVVRIVTAKNERGDIVGALPAVQVKTPHLNVWLSLPYFGPNAGALVARPETPDGRAVVQALASAAVADARALGCGSMTLYTPLASDPDAYRSGFETIDFEVGRSSQAMAIPGDPDRSPWPRKVRYDIRRARALGLTVRPIATRSDLDLVWDLYVIRCREVGIPIKPREHLQALFETAGDHGVFLVAEHGGAIIGGLICFLGGGVLSYYLPAMRRDCRSLQPGLLLLDHAVAVARGRSCRLLNFEASPSVEGSVVQFKARCGGRPVAYRIFVKFLRAGIVQEYRALGKDRIQEEAPHAFVVPFDALS